MHVYRLATDWRVGIFPSSLHPLWLLWPLPMGVTEHREGHQSHSSSDILLMCLRSSPKHESKFRQPIVADRMSHGEFMCTKIIRFTLASKRFEGQKYCTNFM
jgi:hypothetical protein